MKKFVFISLFAIFGITLFVLAEQPKRTVADTTTTSTDTTRTDTVRQMTVHLNPTIHNNIKGD